MLGVSGIQSTYEIYCKILAGGTGYQSRSKAVRIDGISYFTEKHADRAD